jgi:EAL domain-containing protein (putative c-di-GMP-specific phosphodiesterase class I)
MNISPSQLTSDHFALRIEKRLSRYGVDPVRIELEDTEHVFFGNLERSAVVLKPVLQFCA